jgi:hypothetical protein
MFGAALRSGADSAFLYDSLKQVGRENEYQKIQGAVFGNKLLLMAAASLATGFLAEVHMRLPMILSIPSVVVGSVLTFFFVETGFKKTLDTKPVRNKLSAIITFTKEQFKLMKFSVLFVANHKAVKWIVLFSTLIGVSSKVWFFTYNPYFELVHLDLAWYGVVFAFLNVIAWLASKYAYRIEEKLSEKTLVIGLVLLIALPVFLMGSVVGLFSVSLVLFQNIVRGFMEPFFGGFLNKHLDSHNRATVLSIKSAVMGFGQTVMLGLFGFTLGILPLAVNLQLLGVMVLVGGYVGVYTYKKIFS